jgi:hypothetical protein
MPRKPDFYSQMSRDELEKLEAFAREPGRTVDACHDWLLAQGFTASRSAVGRWKKAFDETDALSAASDLCDAINTAHAELGSVDLNKAMQLQLQQRMADKLARDGNQQDIEYYEAAAGIIERLARSGRHNTKHEIELLELRQRNAEAARLLDQAAKAGDVKHDVVSTIKKALGIAA